MVLGCRFAHNAPEAACAQAGTACDIVSVNVYPRVDLFQRNRRARRASPTRLRPVPQAHHAHGVGLPRPGRQRQREPAAAVAERRAGMHINTQEQKAGCYAIFQRDLFSLPFVVGSHYFMWCDEPALGISRSFPEDSNYGLVNEKDEPYRLLTATAARVDGRLAALHAGHIARRALPPAICRRCRGNPAADPSPRTAGVGINPHSGRLYGRYRAAEVGQGRARRKDLGPRRLA